MLASVEPSMRLSADDDEAPDAFGGDEAQAFVSALPGVTEVAMGHPSSLCSIMYGGSVTRIHPATIEDVQLWHVVYEDGDEADLDSQEMEKVQQVLIK